MKRVAAIALLSAAVNWAAVAQDPHAGHAMPPPPPSSPAAADPHAGHQMPDPAGSEHQEHRMPLPDADDGGRKVATGAELPVGDAPRPGVILDSAADRIYGAASMGRARGILADGHGGSRISEVAASILEYAAVDGGGGYRWDVEAWHGGDVHRLVVKTEGEGIRSDGLKNAEAQALYSRAIGRYTDVQMGVRYDLEPDSRAYATLGIESLLPYWFEVEAAFFLSDRGDYFGRLEGSHDLRLTQRLILQPRIELELAAQDVPEAGIGSGVSSAELGLRLRYDIRREFSPYVGVNFEKSFGQTADFARAAGEEREETSFVVGLRGWF